MSSPGAVTPPANGSTGGEIAYNLPEWMAISAFFALAWYNILQLYISIYMTFKRKSGLYFWSLVISGLGVLFHSFGFLLKIFQLTRNNYLSITLITIGWWPMVTGQALVLYSRLHLVVKEQRILNAVLTMIVWNAITLHIPTTVLTFGSSSPLWEHFLPVFNIMERIQMTIFCLQEVIISAVYLWAAFRLLKPIYRRRTRSVMTQLIWINFIMVLMDISMLVMEYLNNYAVEATLKSMIYAIKLVLEFAVLNQLMHIATSRTNPDLEGGAFPHNRPDRDEDVRYQHSGSHSPPKLWKMHPFGEDVQSISPSSAEMSPDPMSGPFNPTVASPTGRARNLSLVTSRSETSRRLKRPSVVSEYQQGRSGSVASTFLNNPAAFVPERRRVFDPFSIEALSPVHSQHASSGDHGNYFCTIPDPPTRPASIYSASSEKADTAGPGPDEPAPVSEKKRERRLSRLSAVVPAIISCNAMARSEKGTERPDSELLQSRRNSVTEEVIDSHSIVWDLDDEESTRNIQDVEQEIAESDANLLRAKEEKERQEWLERVRRADRREDGRAAGV